MLFWKIMYCLLVICIFEMMLFLFLLSYEEMLEMIGILHEEEGPFTFWCFAATMVHAIIFDAMTFFRFQDIIICTFFFCSARIWAALMQLHMCSVKEFIISILIHSLFLGLIYLPG